MSRILAIISLGLMTFMMFAASSGLPILFDPNSPASLHVSPRYIEKSHEEAGSPNFVTAVLADYRAYDTLGETTVIFTAGIATVFLLRATKKDSERPTGGKKDGQ